MRLTLRVLTATAVLAASTLAAYADTYQYAFTFYDITKAPDFSLTIDEPNLISTTSFGPLPTPLATPLGYDVVNFGENAFGSFLFSESGGVLMDNIVLFSSTSFLFLGNGAFVGLGTTNTNNLIGNDPTGFFGKASVTVTDLTPPATTPEPSSFMLLGTGILGFAGAVRKRLA
jgi:hypothetical protein